MKLHKNISVLHLVLGALVFQAGTQALADVINDDLTVNGDVDVSGDVGIGTSTPVVDLHMASGNTPTMRLEQDGSSGFTAQTWDVAGNEVNFFVRDATNGSKLPFKIESDSPTNTLVVDSAGGIGVGTQNPQSKFHVVDTEDTQLLVENNGGAAPSPQFMLELKNASNAKVRFAITSNAGDVTNTWTFDNNPFANHFSISKLGTGVNEFLVEATGDGVFKRNSLAVNHINTSSRTVKTDFAEIDTLDMLERVVSLPITQWRYKVEDESERHIGPVAEDFQAIFKLSDGKMISTVDASGVALAAIQGLKREKDSQIAAKNREIAALRAELQQLRANHAERLLQLEMLLAEVLRNQQPGVEVGAVD